MSYSIGYGEQRQELYAPKTNSHFTLFLFVFLMIFFLGVQLFWDEGAQTIRQLLLPMDSNTVSAFETLTQQVIDGVPIGEAVTFFCREVIQSAQFP